MSEQFEVAIDHGPRWRRVPRSARRWLAEAAALVLLAVAVTVPQLDLLVDGTTVGMDTATAFYPWYTFLGQRLRAGEIPAWNPHQFSGTPFAADPESGWTYLPAMVLFTALPLPAAAAAYVLFHVLLAAFAAYALARTLGLGVPGSFVAAVAYAGNGFLYGHNVCCFAYAGVAAWLPLIILGAERAVQAPTRCQRACWWAVAGLGLSQVFAVWIGQGAYYVVLSLIAYLAYRRFTPVPRSAPAVGARSVALVLDLSGILLFGMGLAAAGLLPRLEFDLLSDLPLGYPDGGSDQLAGAASNVALIDSSVRPLLTPGFYSVGVSVAALAVAAVLLAPRHRGVVCFALFALASMVLALPQPTPLSQAAGMLPAFQRLAGRSPERALLVFYLWPALLAGTAVAAVRRAPASAGPLAIPPPILTGARLLLSVGLVLVVYADLRRAAQVELAEAQRGSAAYELRKLDLSDYYASTETARFLASQAGQFRYAGYAGHVFGGPFPYTLRWADDATRQLEVNNRALVTGLQDVQGYDPIHLDRYDRFVAAMNGREQNYHHTDLFDSGLDSPLLDLLNVRYLVMPTTPAPDQTTPRLLRPVQVVFQNAAVTVFLNPGALPRSWLVHAARQVSPAEALDLIATRAVDPRQVALLERPPPELAPVADPSADQSSVTDDQPEYLQVQVRTDAPGLLVLSEIYYPAWHAYVDGQPVPVYVADGALRAVAVPAGAHQVELRYESVMLSSGIALSLATLAACAALAIASARQAAGLRRRLGAWRRRRSRPPRRCPPGHDRA